MCTLINVIEESFDVYADYCYTRKLLKCPLINVIEESFYVYVD